MLTFLDFSLFMFFIGLMVFSLNRKHLLLMLLSLEFIMLSVYMTMYYYYGLIGVDYYFSMIYLTFGVCEGVLGLSILVSMIRSHGNDYFQSFSVLW